MKTKKQKKQNKTKEGNVINIENGSTDKRRNRF